MNVLYILGNGFDKAQGMKTSYPEFYEYLKTIDPSKESELLKLLKSEITDNTELWSDMEEALGQFTEKIESFDEFENLYYEITDHLQDHLNKEDEKFIPSNDLKTKFQDDFLTLSKYLGDIDKPRFSLFSNSVSRGKEVYAMTFNYTNTLEKLLNMGKSSNKVFDSSRKLNEIIHIHGTLKDTIILGVDNIEQIANKKFRDNDDFKDFMIKLQSNQCMKYTRHLRCADLIASADCIVLHGVSLGDTDAHWWKLIGKQLVTRKNLCIIQHLYAPNAIKPTKKHLMGRVERQHQNLLFKKMRIEESNITDDLKSRLFFTVNAPVFIK